jgi:hypothetical protein
VLAWDVLWLSGFGDPRSGSVSLGDVAHHLPLGGWGCASSGGADPERGSLDPRDQRRSRAGIGMGSGGSDCISTEDFERLADDDV